MIEHPNDEALREFRVGSLDIVKYLVEEQEADIHAHNDSALRECQAVLFGCCEVFSRAESQYSKCY